MFFEIRWDQINKSRLLYLDKVKKQNDQNVLNEKLVEPRSTIYKKSLIAATKANLPIENSLTYEYSDYYLGDILKNRKSVSHEYLRKMRLRDEPIENRLDYIENAMK